MQLTRLIKTAKPYESESLASLILRLSEYNYYGSPGYLYEAAGLSFNNPNIIDKGQKLAWLSELTGIDEEKLYNIGFTEVELQNGKSMYKISGQTIGRYAIHSRTTKVCPFCLRESPYGKAVWDLSIVTACPQHRLMLIDRCPICKRMLSWRRKSILYCDCGFDLRHNEPIALTKEETLFSSLIYHKIKPLFNHTEQSPLSLLSLFETSKIIFFLAGAYMGVHDTTGKFIGAITENNNLHWILHKAYTTFQHWPTNYYEFLDWLKRRNSKNAVADTGIQKDFGQFYHAIYNEFSQNPFSFMGSEFESYLKSWDGGYINNKNRIEHQESNFVSQKEAVKALSVRDSDIKRLISKGYVTGTIKQMGKRHLVLVELDSLKKYKGICSGTISLTECALRLGVGHENVVDLIKAKYIDAFRGPNKDGYPKWVIKSSSVEGLIEKIQSLSCREDSSEEKENLITFRQCIRMLSAQGYTVEKIMNLVFSGELMPVSHDEGVGLRGLMFSRKQVRSILDNKLEARQKEYLTVIDIAKTLCIKQEVARFWVDKGFITGTKVGNIKEKRRVLLQSLNQFEETYITAAQMANIMNISPRHVVDECSKKGISAISGPSIDGGRQYLFRIEDVSKLLSNEPNKEA